MTNERGGWADDINCVKKILDKNRKAPPRHMNETASQYPYKKAAASFGGAAAWAKMLLLRIQQPYPMLSTSHHIVTTKEYLEVYETYKTVEQAIKAYMQHKYQEWIDHMEKVFRSGEDMMSMNVVQCNSQTQLLEVTFPNEVALLFKEIEAWERVGFSTPFVAMENAKDKDRLNVARSHVRAMAADYNSILSALEPWERKLFSDKLKALDRKIGPALTRISWASKGTVDFCKDSRKACAVSQGMVDEFKGLTSTVARSCRKMSNLAFVHIEHKRLYTAAEFEAVQARHRSEVTETLGRLALDIKTTLKLVFRLFLADGPESKRELDRFILRTDQQVEKALSEGVKKSLQSLARAINGDKKTESQQLPLFVVRVVTWRFRVSW